jgi:hypothetical protein
VLADFAAEHGVTFPLLADRGSRVIERLGLLNQHVAAQQAHYGMPVSERHDRLPYPGTFMLDESGVVVERRFEQSYRVRPSGTTLFEDLLGTAVGDPQVSAQAAAPGVRAVAWLDTATYRPQQELRLRVAIEVDAGLHLYTAPTPDGFTALEVGLEGPEGLISGSPPLPAGEPFTVAGLDERFNVVEGRIETVVPFRIESYQGPVTLQVRLRHQACSDRVCHAPGELRLALELDGRDVLRRPD